VKQFGKIYKFELMSYLTNKVFVGTTLFLVAAIAVVMFFPAIIGAFEGGEKEAPQPDSSVNIYAGTPADDGSFGTNAEDNRPVMILSGLS